MHLVDLLIHVAKDDQTVLPNRMLQLTRKSFHKDLDCSLDAMLSVVEKLCVMDGAGEFVEICVLTARAFVLCAQIECCSLFRHDDSNPTLARRV